MSHEQVSIRTRDGDCPAYVFTPSEAGRHPGVIFYMDGLGIRPTIFEMGQRLADHGYVVLVPDLFYRAGRYEPLDPKKVFASGDVMGCDRSPVRFDRQSSGGRGHRGVPRLPRQPRGRRWNQGGHDRLLHGRSDVADRGGNLSRPDRSGGQLPRRQPGHRLRAQPAPARAPDRRPGLCRRGRPGRLVPARDGSTTRPGAQRRGRGSPLRDLSRALHGWTMADFPVYNEAAAERHWDELVAFSRTRSPEAPEERESSGVSQTQRLRCSVANPGRAPQRHNRWMTLSVLASRLPPSWSPDRRRSPSKRSPNVSWPCRPRT